MSRQLTVLRGPLLNSTQNTRSHLPDKSFVYIKDALIILDGNKIVDFGPVSKLKKILAQNVLVKLHRECRIIKSTAGT